ncbi:MAG: 3-hydroxybutyrate dehydrogenase [Burkholderiales bacterium]
MTPRRILITGAGSGIGAELAALLATAGHDIIASDIDRAAALRVADAIVTRGGKATGYGLDVTQPTAVETAVRAAGRVDVLVNNAGLQHVARLEEFPADRWAFLVAVMLTGAAYMARAVLPGMRARNFGRIVNIGSIHSLVASPFKSAYIAAKHGLIGLSKTLALENGDVDVTVNTICPVYVRTPLVEKQIEAQAREHGITPERVVSDIMLRPMPKKAFVTVAEIAALTEYLISDAARNVTAQAIAIDGGWTAQ